MISCICCDRDLETEVFCNHPGCRSHVSHPCEECGRSFNPMVIPLIYGGLVFRSTGNYGSTVFDPMPAKKKEMLQVVICDVCIKMKAKKVTHIHDIKEEVSGESGEFKP